MSLISGQVSLYLTFIQPGSQTRPSPPPKKPGFMTRPYQEFAVTVVVIVISRALSKFGHSLSRAKCFVMCLVYYSI